MSGDFYSHTDRKYDEIIERLEALEKKLDLDKRSLYNETAKRDEKALGNV